MLHPRLKAAVKELAPPSLLEAYRAVANTVGTRARRLRRAPHDERVSFDSQTIFAGHFKVSYRGVPTSRCPFDYVLYQMILTSVRPELVIEIGTSHGGGALYLADLLEMIGPGMVHTIDLKAPTTTAVRQHPRIRVFADGWERYDLVETAPFRKILVIDDGSHVYEDTLGALRKFAPVVSPESYLIVEDGIVTELGQGPSFRGGPLRAIREFLEENTAFAVDRTYCDMFGKNATFNVNGYLKRRPIGPEGPRERTTPA
jgi:cephalosporin hydroxylase